MLPNKSQYYHLAPVVKLIEFVLRRGGKTKEQLEPEFDEAERRLNEAIEQVQSLGDLSTVCHDAANIHNSYILVRL